MGDFNLPDINWCIPTCTNNRGKQGDFLSLFSSYSLTQKVLVPTRKNNTLDLIFESQPGLIQATDIDAPLTKGCDHSIVRFSAVAEPVEPVQEPTFDFNNADYASMKVFLDLIDWSVLFEGCASVDEKWGCFRSIADEVIEMFVPKKTWKKSGKIPKRT